MLKKSLHYGVVMLVACSASIMAHAAGIPFLSSPPTQSPPPSPTQLPPTSSAQLPSSIERAAPVTPSSSVSSRYPSVAPPVEGVVVNQNPVNASNDTGNDMSSDERKKETARLSAMTANFRKMKCPVPKQVNEGTIKTFNECEAKRRKQVAYIYEQLQVMAKP